MSEFFRRGLTTILCLSFLLSTPVPLMAETVAPQNSIADLQVVYFAHLDQEMPWLTEFAFGEDLGIALPRFAETPGLIDQDPFFLRSQSWVTAPRESACASICFSKEDGALTILSGGRALRLNQSLTPVLETSQYLILTADDSRLFAAKNSSDEPGEGFFYISKGDLESERSVPVFFFPLPGAGWTGANPASLEMEITDQLVLVNQEKFALPIQIDDLKLLEKVSRNNLLLARAWSSLETGNLDKEILPKSGATAVFGLYLTEFLPTKKAVITKNRSATFWSPPSHLMRWAPESSRPVFGEMLSGWLLPRAEAGEAIAKPVVSLRAKLGAWVAPLALYGGTFTLAGLAYDKVDWSSLITADMPERIAKVSYLLGAVLVGSVAMRYSIHKEKFDKKYPKVAGESWLSRLNKEHKAILDELVYGLYFSVSSLPLGIQHTLAFFKDRFFPNNKLVKAAWDATMGFQLKQNSTLAMNWKTFYLGSLVFGMADSMMVALDMLIFTPYITQHWGAGIIGGATAAAFVSAEIFRNFLSYLQSGAHSYSAEVKMIHMKSSEEIAKRLMRTRKMDPDSPKNVKELSRLTELELAKRYRAVDLPTQEEFLYDPNTFLRWMTKQSGYNLDENGLSQSQKENLAKTDFVLSEHKWGLIKPSLKKALATAEELRAQAGLRSEVGERTINLLKWASSNRSLVSGVVGQAWDTVASSDGANNLRASIEDAVGKSLVENKTSNSWSVTKAMIKGTTDHFLKDGTQDARDIRQVLFLMSTCGSAKDVVQFFPKSWLDKAGSEEAAMMAAELFHRSFFASYEDRPQLIAPSAELLTQYSDRVQKIINRAAVKESSLNDPFVRLVRGWELTARLDKKDKDRDMIVNFKPKAGDTLAEKQWAQARASAEKIIQASDADDEVSSEWLGLAAKYNERSENPMPPEAWIKSYRYRLTIARQYAKQVGLEIDDPQSSTFVGESLVAASINAENQLSRDDEKFYLKSLTANERAFYEAQVFTQNFVQAYVERFLRDENISAATPEYPGRFQKVRRALVGVKGGKILSGAVRFFEAFFRNEETAYLPGRLAMLERSLPVLPDMAKNFVRNLRVLPYMLTFSYLVSYFVWQIHMPYALWTFFGLTSFSITSLVEFNNRLMKNFGIRPMKDVPSKLTYSWVHSRLTNPQIMVTQAYAGPISNGIDGALFKPIRDCAEILVGKR